VHRESVLLGLRVELHPKVVSVGYEDRPYGLLEVNKVVFRAPYLEGYSSQIGGHGWEPTQRIVTRREASPESDGGRSSLGENRQVGVEPNPF
jgi:hypothetical protein